MTSSRPMLHKSKPPSTTQKEHRKINPQLLETQKPGCMARLCSRGTGSSFGFLGTEFYLSKKRDDTRTLRDEKSLCDDKNDKGGWGI